jgi:hypothetical protein
LFYRGQNTYDIDGETVFLEWKDVKWINAAEETISCFGAMMVK